METFTSSSQKIIIQSKKEAEVEAIESSDRVTDENCSDSRLALLKSPLTCDDFPSSSEILDSKPSPSLTGLNFNLSVESSSVGDIPPPSSVSSSSSSSTHDQSEFNAQSPYKTPSYDGNSQLATRILEENNATAADLLSTPLLKRRGPGRPRKDGNVNAVAKKKIISNPISRVHMGRPRGRKRQVDRGQHSTLGGLLSGLSAQFNDSFKMGETASVSLFNQLIDNQEKFEMPDLDSDNSISSAMSFERFPSEDISQEIWLGKTCSLCNLGDKSLLGQGELNKYEPTTGFNPFRKSPKSRRGSCESERDLQIEKTSKVTWRRQKGRSSERSKSPRRSDDDSNWQLVDELGTVGFAEEPDVVNLFEPSGHTYAHHCCASWSDGVCQTDDYVLINVDKAVVFGLNQKCSSCQRFGASIRCRGPKCNKTYHYPCAVSSGTFQDIKTMTLLCPVHLHLAPSIEMSLKGDNPRLVQGRITDVNNTADSESNCIVCDTPGNISELLFCTSCGHHYHGQCLDPIVAVNPVVRSGWQCPDCKICHTCRQPGDDNKMLVCDACDKSYHTYCLKPVITSIPKHGWKCKSCRVCGDCGARTPGSGPSSRWHINYSVCDSCYQQRNKGLACLICGRAYRHFAQKEMIMCMGCKKFVHGKCDKDFANLVKDGELPSDYLCLICRKSSKHTRTGDSKELSTWTISNYNSKAINDDTIVPDYGIFPCSHDSSIPTNEDSFGSMDIDIQAIERSAQQLQQFDLFDDFIPNSGKVFPITLPNPGKLSGKKRMGIGRPRGGSKFVGMKRRAKTVDMGKRRGPKPKLKPLFGVTCQNPLGDSSPVKLEEEPVLENKIVLCSAKDEFVLCQDMCIMCGSYGQGEEGRLISCSQCGQCYHPYCVSIKVNKVLLSKGWRCLDCTVCEGCGQPHDEGRLLLCDDCDISYHIYCLDPPLEQVPQGNWKCKWCVVCQYCGSTEPGFNCQWQSNYTQCGPCSSQLMCPVCRVDYKEDELLIQCIQCDRWLHAGCDEMNTEDDAEKSADYGYHCLLCRPKSQPPPHLLPPLPPSPPKSVEPKPPTPPVPKASPEPIIVKVKPQPGSLLDGVYLSESGMNQIKSLTLEQPKKQRVRRNKLTATKNKQGCENEDSQDQSMEIDKTDAMDEDLIKDLPMLEDVPVEKKKRQRNLNKLGVGGFVVRCRGRNLHKDEKEESIFNEIGDNQNEGLESSEKPKRRRRLNKKKSQLEDSFPSYLQEAFFGKELLVNNKSLDSKFEVSSDEDVTSPMSRLTNDKMVNIIEEEKPAKPSSHVISKISKDTLKKEDEEGTKDEVDDDLANSDSLKDILPLSHDLTQDDDLVKMLMNEDETLSKSEVLDAINENDLRSAGMSSPNLQSAQKDEPLMKDDPLTDILSPHFNIDTMVGDSGLPQIDGKDVEDLFKGVLTDNLPQGPADSSFRSAASALPPHLGPAIIDAPTAQHPVPRPPLSASVAMSSPFSVPPPSPYPSEYSSSSQFSPAFSEPPPSPWVPPEPELETQSYNQRSSLKWEKDEILGLSATISAVLYANTNHPDLKAEYPLWTDRAKQIAKIWRALPSEKRTPYVAKARENRTASRLQKTQQMKESGPSSSSASSANTTTPKQGKRPKQGKTPPAPAPEPVEVLVDPNSSRRPLPIPPPPPPPPPPPVSLPPPSHLPPTNEKEQERIAREQKAHREQEQERQWKALQAIRQQQAQQQQQILQEQRAQVPTQQPHPLPAMVRVQQQMMGGEQLIKSPTSCGSITPTTPSSPNQIDQFGGTMPMTSLPMNNSESFCSPSTVQPHTNIMQEHPSQQVRLVSQDQLHGSIGVTPLSPLQPAVNRGSGPFTPPIQVSRVRPPIDTSQMHSNVRMQVNDPYAQMPGTPRPAPTNSNLDSFSRPLSHQSPLSPQIVRSPVRFQDPYMRQPFTPRPQSHNEGFAASGQNNLTSKPMVVGEIYSKPQLVGTPRPQMRDSLSPANPRTPDVFHTPPSTPHTPNQDGFSSTTPTNESFSQQPVASSNHPASPFSPSHTTHMQVHPQEHYSHSHAPRMQDPYSQQPATPRPDPYLQPPSTPRPPMQQLSDMFGQQPQSKLAISPVARSPQMQQQTDMYSQSPRPNDQFQVNVDSRQRPKMNPIYSNQNCEQSPHLLEHYGQPRTPNTPRLNPSPLDDPYAQAPMTPRPINSPSATCSRPTRVEQFQMEGDLVSGQGVNPGSMDQDQAQQIARLQLRDLLQKQQIKKQDPVSPQGQLPLRHWPLEQTQDVESNQSNIHPNLQECIRMANPQMVRPQQLSEMPKSVMSPGDNSFRQPYPPGMRIRIPMGAGSPNPHQMPQQQLHGQPQALINQFRHPGQVLDPRSQAANVGDPQMRMAILQQQQRLVHASQLRGMNVNRLPLGLQQQQQQQQQLPNSIDPYDNLVQQQQQQQRMAMSQQLSAQPQQQMSPLGPNQMRMFTYQQGSMGMRQQFVQINSQQSQQIRGQVVVSSPSQQMAEFNVGNMNMESNTQQQMCDANDSHQITGLMRPMSGQSSSALNSGNENLLTSDINEDHNNGSIPGVPLEGDPSTAEKVAEELQRIEKETSGDLLHPKLEDPEDDLDDDELLGLGNDFNILEYADPELDKDIVGDGKKTNILDENLDLDDKDEDLEDDEVKTKVDSPEVRVSDIKVEIEDNANQAIEKGGNLDEKQGSSSGGHLGKSDFQAKFLEFSQKRELEKAEELKGDSIFDEDNIDGNSMRKTDGIDIKTNVKTDLSLGDMMHNMPSASFSNATNTTNILSDNSVSSVMSPSNVCQMSPMGSNQMYMPQDNNQMMMLQRPIRPPFSQQMMQGSLEMRHQIIGQQQQHQQMVKMPQPPPPPPPYPGARPPPPYQPIRGPPMQPSQMANRGTYNTIMLGFRPPHPNQGPSHSVPLSLNPAIRQAQVNEQRLLLEDLLEQEKQEQRRQLQQQHHGLLSQTHSDEPLLSDLEFEKLKADVLGTSGLPGSLSPPGSGLPAQGILPLHSSVSPSSLKASSPGHCGPMLSPGLESHDNSQQMIGGRPVQVQQNLGGQMLGAHHQPQQQLPPPPSRVMNQMVDSGIHPALMQGVRPPLPITSIPPPQTPPAEAVTEADRQLTVQYENWLFQQQHILSSQLKYFETEVAKLRKSRKSLNTKKRNLSKTGGQLSDTDSMELERITKDQNSLQKQLDQVRKQSRQHAMIMQEYHMKQQKHQQQQAQQQQQQQVQQQQQIINPQQVSVQHSPHGGAGQSPMMNQGPSTPMSPLMSPSPLGPAHSPLRQQSPSPMLQHSPLPNSHSPLVQHPSPLGQQVFHQQSSPRHCNPNLAMDQQVMRQSGIQTSQEDNNPFSDSFQHRELRPPMTPRQSHVGFQEDLEDRKPFKDQSCSPSSIQRWGQPNRALCNIPPEQNIKLVPRNFHPSLGSRMMSPASDQLHQPVFQSNSGQATGVSIERDLSHCSTNIQPRLSPMGQSPTHYSLSSPNCSQADRSIVTSLGNCIQTTSPSLSTGSGSHECSPLASSHVPNNLDSFQMSSQSPPAISQLRLHENVAETRSHLPAHEPMASSLGMLLSDSSSSRQIFNSPLGPNSEQDVKNIQSNSEDSVGNNEFSVENNGSCVRIPLRHLSSFEHPTTNSTSKIDCLQAKYSSAIKNVKLKSSSLEMQQTFIKSEFRNNHCAMETNILHFSSQKLMIKPEICSDEIELYNSVNELYNSGFNKDKLKFGSECVFNGSGDIRRAPILNGFTKLKGKKFNENWNYLDNNNCIEKITDLYGKKEFKEQEKLNHKIKIEKLNNNESDSVNKNEESKPSDSTGNDENNPSDSNETNENNSSGSSDSGGNNSNSNGGNDSNSGGSGGGNSSSSGGSGGSDPPSSGGNSGGNNPDDNNKKDGRDKNDTNKDEDNPNDESKSREDEEGNNCGDKDNNDESNSNEGKNEFGVDNYPSNANEQPVVRTHVFGDSNENLNISQTEDSKPVNENQCFRTLIGNPDNSASLVRFSETLSNAHGARDKILNDGDCNLSEVGEIKHKAPSAVISQISELSGNYISIPCDQQLGDAYDANASGESKHKVQSSIEASLASRNLLNQGEHATCQIEKNTQSTSKIQMMETSTPSIFKQPVLKEEDKSHVLPRESQDRFANPGIGVSSSSSAAQPPSPFNVSSIKYEHLGSEHVSSTTSSVSLTKSPFPIGQPRTSGTFIKMPLHKAQKMSLATQLSTQLNVLTGNHPQSYHGGMGRGLSRGLLVPSVQPRSMSSTAPCSTMTPGGIPRVSQVGIPNPIAGRNQQLQISVSSLTGANQELKSDDDSSRPEPNLFGGQIVVKQEITASASVSSGFLGECSKDQQLASKVGKEKRLFNFALASNHMENVAKSDSKPDGQEGSPQNALLKQLLQTSQPSSQFPKKQERVELSPVQPPPAPVPAPAPPPVYDTAAEVIASVAQLPPSPEHSLSSNDCGLTEEERSRVSLDEFNMKSVDNDGAKGKRSKGVQSKRQPKQKQVKDTSAPAKKRARKGSNPKLEEDYDGYMENLRIQLQNLPNLRILEPDIQPNFNVCPLTGSGNLSATAPKISGGFGSCSFNNNKPEFYLENPDSAAAAAAVVLPPTPPPQRGFYNQEFPSRYCAPIDDQRISVGPDLRRPMEIPSSLLTPPPCANDKRDFNSPDIIVSSSSPECSLFEPPCRYPYLKLIDEGNEADLDLCKSASPHVPLYFPIPIRARPLGVIERRSSLDFDDENQKDKENMMVGENKAEKEALLIRTKLGFRPPVPLKDSANVAITLTLTSSAAEDIRGVLSAVADLLKIPAPVSFEITERTVTPPSQKMGLYKKGKDPTASMKSFLNGQPKFCRHCDVVVITAGIKKRWSEMPFMNKDEQDEEEVMFCSTNCYMQFALSHRVGAQTTEKEVAAVVDHLCNVLSPNQSRSKTKSTSSGKSSPMSESSKEDNKNEDSQGSNKISRETPKTCSELFGSKKDQLPSSKDSSPSSSSSVRSPRRPIESRTDRDRGDEPTVKKWREVRWKHWSLETISRPTYAPPSEEEIHSMLDRLNVSIKPDDMPSDTRSCVLCQEVGDGLTTGSARLLNMDVDKWVHLNCALWSSEVYETVNGALMNVEIAVKRGFTIDCVVCKKKGATLGCFRLRCTNLYHFPCAIKDKCMFFKDKTLLCPLHVPKQLTPEMKENELHNLSVPRRVYINRDENRQVASMMHRGDCNFLLRVGNLMFLSIGQLLPHQLQAFHTRNFIYPVGYKVIRMYWSMRSIGKRCQYICSIQDSEGKPEFHIQVKEFGFSDVHIQARTARGVWQQIIEPIDRMRREANAIKVFTAFITGEDLYGLNEPSILRVIESLPGVETLSDYNFKYGRSPLLDLPLAINPTGCAKTEPKLRTHFKRPHTLHTSSSSRTSFQVAITGLEAACPYTKQFIHSKAAQYRKMKVEWRNNVYLARSRIQGLGLYAAREIEKHTMVIEYLGELIRNEVAEKRERYYEDQNRGIYMFRVDDGRVIDASLTGGLARYINHSCNPNCVAEVVQIDRENRIIIFACRRIARGEELCYDYKFDIEDDQHKIPCLCGAPNCKKWMN